MKLQFRRIGNKIIPILPRKDKSVFLDKPKAFVKTGALKAAVEKTRELRALGKKNEKFKRARQWSTFYVREALKKLPKKYKK